MSDFFGTTTAIVTAVIGLAIVAVLVSKNAQTGSVISAAGSAFQGILSTAVSPVSGGGSSSSSSSGIGSFLQSSGNILGGASSII